VNDLPAISVDSISKLYRISHTVGRRSRYRTLTESITSMMKAPLQKLRNASLSGEIEDFWALRDVSFQVQRGELLGVIGANGAGKSTLLKILTRITEPTRGEARTYGRVGSLLEVGTGFHPELTGRENIYLNGTILGMRRSEIRREFDRIVEFSGVEQFLDTPVKRYSSGMRVRLAFSVAAHLQPEILLIDEVLAVGDVAFQQRCLGRMGEIASSGRTVLFVSHNMNAVQRLCRRGILLEGGRIVCDRDVATVVDAYFERQLARAGTGEIDVLAWQGDRRGPTRGKIAAVRTLDESGQPGESFGMSDPLAIEADVQNMQGGFTIAFSVTDRDGNCVYQMHSQDSPLNLTSAGERQGVRMTIPQLRLRDGTYFVHVTLGDKFNRLEESVHGVLSFTVRNAGETLHRSEALIYEPGQWSLAAPNSDNPVETAAGRM